MGSMTSLAPKGGAPGAAPNPIINFVPLAFVIIIFYVLFIRPQQKQAKDHRRMVDNLKPGDRVLTQGGIYGTVTAIRGGIIQLKIADNVKVDVSRTGIAQVMQETNNGTAVNTGETVS